MKPKNPAVIKVVANAFKSGRTTSQMLPKNKYSMRAKISATAVPKRTRSDLIKSIISEVIIVGPPR